MTGEPLIQIRRLLPNMDAVHVTAIITGTEQAHHGSIALAFLARLLEYEAQQRGPSDTPTQHAGRCLRRANNVVRQQMSAPLVILR